MASEDRQRRLPWVALGLTTTLTAAIVFALWASSLGKSTPVAVAGRDIPAGSAIEIGDIRAVEVAGGQGAEFVPMAEVDALVGGTVRSPVPEGAFLHPDLLSPVAAPDADMAVVGAVLFPGEYPVAHLSVGRQVGVVLPAPPADQAAVGRADLWSPAAATGPGADITRVTVAEVSPVLESGREALFVSLLAAPDEAVLISRAAATGQMRLILLPGAPSTSDQGPDTGTMASGPNA
ncbi:SAF domain-containing protein [Candidatus Poriferisocius sp.]|uniref:SAF domain-containing protein n=1 Tax=Candidatus Poriferisocius sp. TaxID=3101276 RepID=UPI003B5CC9D6